VTTTTTTANQWDSIPRHAYTSYLFIVIIIIVVVIAVVTPMKRAHEQIRAGAIKIHDK
jgi:uncharacterized membrane protein